MFYCVMTVKVGSLSCAVGARVVFPTAAALLYQVLTLFLRLFKLYNYFTEVVWKTNYMF